MRKYEKARIDKIAGNTHRVDRRRTIPEAKELELMSITDATLVTNSGTAASNNYRWRYDVTPAKLTWTGSPAVPTVTARDTSGTPPEFSAFSISELGNGTNYAYGVNNTHLPTGIVPVRIPDGTPVLCWCQMRRYNDGQQMYLIINTQAITGTCP